MVETNITNSSRLTCLNFVDSNVQVVPISIIPIFLTWYGKILILSDNCKLILKWKKRLRFKNFCKSYFRGRSYLEAVVNALIGLFYC